MLDKRGLDGMVMVYLYKKVQYIPPILLAVHVVINIVHAWKSGCGLYVYMFVAQNSAMHPVKSPTALF